jgi:hypothetical protein
VVDQKEIIAEIQKMKEQQNLGESSASADFQECLNNSSTNATINDSQEG